MPRTYPLTLFFAFGLVSANFDFFGNMFGHTQQQHQSQSSTPQWAAQVDSIPCSQYLCPITLDCVRKPMDCPCPDVQDVKCMVPDLGEDEDGTYVCVRGQNGCTEVERLMRRGAKPSRTK